MYFITKTYKKFFKSHVAIQNIVKNESKQTVRSNLTIALVLPARCFSFLSSGTSKMSNVSTALTFLLISNESEALSSKANYP